MLLASVLAHGGQMTTDEIVLFSSAIMAAIAVPGMVVAAVLFNKQRPSAATEQEDVGTADPSTAATTSVTDPR